MTIEEIRNKVIPLLRNHGIEYAALFGSAARGEAGPDSDVDILVRYAVTPGLFDHIGLAQTLEDTLQTKVDLVTERSLNQLLVSRVRPDLKILYGQSRRSDLR
jgi:predicted nucleotidyltransferase